MGIRNLIPNGRFLRVQDITLDQLRALGIRGVAFDLDNTITPYHTGTLLPGVETWLNDLRADGMVFGVVSNNRNPEYVRGFCELHGFSWVSPAGKPSPKGYRKVAEQLGLKPEEMLFVGDQIYTDTFGAKRAGMRAAIVLPYSRKRRPFYYIRLLMEFPFRIAAKKGELS